ncbi:MAG: Holliday junction branch migration protein RuvA [Puniceicoccales bacterium]|jgi:Holliday junction DNA helicase RuvA|nr:Holliday junction branch migration protein RuvA [Puniceicoccales bacterium]
MIVSLSGVLLESAVFRVVVECGGVGYEVHIPVTTTEKLPPTGAKVFLHTLQIFREDAQTLYGFAGREERDFFRLIVEKVTGIGPRIALNIFSRLSLPTLKNAIANGDVKLLSSCPGIGRKTAERLVIELRDKALPGGGSRGAGLPSLASSRADADASSSLQHDAVAALVTLGLKLADADKAVRRALEKNPEENSVEKLIRGALGN